MTKPLAVHAALAAVALAALAPLSTGCRNDPAVQSIIDSLGPETGTPSATHRPGQPCLACHTSYDGASPEFAVAGTLYGLAAGGGSLVPAPNVRVVVEDSIGVNGEPGVTRTACSNSVGNFYILASDWADPLPTFPLSPRVNVIPSTGSNGTGMVSLIGRDGSCATCHMLPAQVNAMSSSDLINPVTGAGHFSAGVVIADTGAVDPTCEASQ
jgi:hypothetical protein